MTCGCGRSWPPPEAPAKQRAAAPDGNTSTASQGRARAEAPTILSLKRWTGRDAQTKLEARDGEVPSFSLDSERCGDALSSRTRTHRVGGRPLPGKPRAPKPAGDRRSLHRRLRGRAQSRGGAAAREAAANTAGADSATDDEAAREAADVERRRREIGDDLDALGDLVRLLHTAVDWAHSAVSESNLRA
jgi:hypothetical protein